MVDSASWEKRVVYATRLIGVESGQWTVELKLKSSFEVEGVAVYAECGVDKRARVRRSE